MVGPATKSAAYRSAIRKSNDKAGEEVGRRFPSIWKERSGGGIIGVGGQITPELMGWINVTPVEGFVGFNVKYCRERVSIPGFGCPLEQPGDLIAPLRAWGCADWQIRQVLQLLENRPNYYQMRQIGTDPSKPPTDPCKDFDDDE